MTIRAASSVWDLLRGALATRALAIVADLGVATVWHRTAGELDASANRRSGESTG